MKTSRWAAHVHVKARLSSYMWMEQKQQNHNGGVEPTRRKRRVSPWRSPPPPSEPDLCTGLLALLWGRRATVDQELRRNAASRRLPGHLRWIPPPPLDPPASTYGFLTDAWSLRTVCPRHFCCRPAEELKLSLERSPFQSGSGENQRGGGTKAWGWTEGRRCGMLQEQPPPPQVEGGTLHWYLQLQKSGLKNKALHP